MVINRFTWSGSMRTPQSVGAKWPKMLSCCLHYILALPNKCHSGNRDSSDYTVFFPPSLQSLYCPIMVLFCKLYPQFPVFHWYEWHAGTLWPICINTVQHFADSPLHSLEAASGGCDFLYALFHLSDSDHHGYISKPFVLIWIFGFNFSLSSLPRLHG